MRGVDLHTVETGLLGASGGDRVPGHGGPDLLGRHGYGAAESAAVPAQVDGDRGRAPRDAGHVGSDLAAGVVDLHPDRPAAGLASPGPLDERLQRSGSVEHHTGRAGQRLGVDHDVAGDQQPGAARRPTPVQAEQLLVGKLAAAWAMFSSMAALAIRLFSTCPERRDSGENSSLVIGVPLSITISITIAYDVCGVHIKVAM